jgi:hypothetical protein
MIADAVSTPIILRSAGVVERRMIGELRKSEMPNKGYQDFCWVVVQIVTAHIDF